MTYQAEVLADSPEAFFPMGESSGSYADISGNGRTLTPVNAPTQGGEAPTIFTGGASALLNGTNQRFTSDVPFSGETDYTLEFWMKTSDTQAMLASSRSDSPTSNRSFTTHYGTSPVGTSPGSGGLSVGMSGYNTWRGAATSGLSLADDVWHHIVVVLTPPVGENVTNAHIAIYVDGVLKSDVSSVYSSGDNAIAPFNAATWYFAGGGVDNAGGFLSGRLSNIAVYPSALSQARVEAHYLAGTTAPSALRAVGGAESDAVVDAIVEISAVPGEASGSGQSDAYVGAAIVNAGVVDNREGGRWRQAIGFAEWVPAVVPIEGTLIAAKDTALAFSVPTVDPDNGRVSYAATQTSVTRHRDRILVGGKDVTSWRGVMTPLPEYSLVEPLGYGPATLVLPQVAAAFEEPGVGALSFLKLGTSMWVQRVDDEGDIVSTDYKGVIIAFGIEGSSLTCTVGGEASGRAALREKQVPIFFWRKDLGRYAHDAIKGLRLPFDPYLGPDTGIDVMRFGGLGYLEFLQQLCAMGTTRSGQQWTIMPDWETGKYEMFRKDVTTIRGTVYNDDTRTVASLSRDLGEEPNRIYATGVTPEGMRARFGRYPGLKQTPAPPYPMNDGSSFGQGTTDGDTDTGDGITILIDRLYITKYLGREQLPGGYDADVTRAVKDLQKDAGLNRTGNVNVKTWAALYDLTTTGFSLRGSHIGPAAEDPKVRPWNLSGSGGKMSRNPSFDRNVLPVDRNVDVGTGFDRGQIREWAETELEDSQSEPNWIGTITFNTNALVAGVHTPGDPLAEADLLRARDLRAGDNLWLPLFSGGITVHVSAVQVSVEGIVSVDVDTRARDSLEVWEVIARNREARRSLRREWIRENRSSTQTKDSTSPWDEVGGILYDKVALKGNRWNVFPVVAGQEGTIQRLRVRTNPNAEYVMAVFGRRIYPARLRKLVGNPLTTAGNKNWLKESVRDALDESNVLLYVAGSDKQPCGYFPKKKTGRNDADTGAAPLTGRWEDDSTFPYRCFPSTVLWVAVWPDRDTTVPQGRIMWPQLEAGT